MEAGSDTTASTLLSYILGILSNPKALEKAQDEIDGICGSSRSPTFDDLGGMPYLKACMNEVSRSPLHFFGIEELIFLTNYLDAALAPCCSGWRASHAHR